jgi:hypothetical protein
MTNLPDAHDLFFSADVLCFSTIVLHSQGSAELTAGCFLTDSVAGVVRVDARWEKLETVSPWSEIKPGAILRLSGNRIMFLMEHNPPFLGLIEPECEILQPNLKGIPWRQKMNTGLDKEIYLSECFIWVTTDGESEKRPVDQKPYLQLN